MKWLKITGVVLAILMIAAAIKVYLLFQAITPDAMAVWQQHNPDSRQQVGHQLWQTFLQRYLVAEVDGRAFDYASVSEADKKQLKQYLVQLQAQDPRQLNRNEQLAYWANLYNALTIDLVLEHYPISSIKDIGDGVTGPWNMPLAQVAGNTLTLNQIEHKILRPIFNEPRIHYVINCASIGCPDLPAQALTGIQIEQQLQQAAKRFINQQKGVNFQHGELTISSIFQWFAQDFGNNEQAVVQHLQKYAEPALKQQLQNYHGSVNYYYNWKLNQPN